MALRIAVFMPEFKWNRMNLGDIKPDIHGVTLTAVDLAADLSNYDGILHKFTYQLADGHEADVTRIAEYCKSRPNFIVIEPIANIRVFTDRLVLQDFFRAHPLPDFIELNTGVVFRPGSSLPFEFPILLKSSVACGVPSSHFIHIVRSQAQLDSLPPQDFQVIAYPFVPHHGVVFKIYSLAAEITWRPSSSIVLSEDEVTSFDSQKPLPDGIANANFNDEFARSIAPSAEELRALSENLRASTGVQLLGFDLLRREADGKLVLVDLNYFPCFRGIDDVPGKFAEFIRSKAARE
jgi:hypothetical protein